MQREEFDLWLKTTFIGVFRVAGHKFEKTATGEVLIDRGTYTREEAELLFLMLHSRNPFTRLNAEIVISERNGTLIKAILVVAIILFVILITRIR